MITEIPNALANKKTSLANKRGFHMGNRQEVLSKRVMFSKHMKPRNHEVSCPTGCTGLLKTHLTSFLYLQYCPACVSRLDLMSLHCFMVPFLLINVVGRLAGCMTDFPPRAVSFTAFIYCLLLSGVISLVSFLEMHTKRMRKLKNSKLLEDINNNWYFITSNRARVMYYRCR